MRRAIGLAVVAWCAACHPAPPVGPRPLATGTCLDLPGAFRGSIQLAPEHDAAYWIEEAWQRDGLNQLRRRLRLVRLDLATGAVTPIADDVDSPFRVLPHGVVVARREDRTSFTVIEPGHDPWDLVVPDDDDTKLGAMAVDATGEHVAINHDSGVIEVFRIADRHRIRLPVNGWVLFMDGDYVVFSHDDTEIAEIAPGLPSAKQLGKLPADGWFASGKSVFYVAPDLIGRWERGGQTEVVQRGEGTVWGFTDQITITNDVSPSTGAVFTGAHRANLPRLDGGGRYAGAVHLPDGRFLALVAHDTRFDNDIDERDERDVCVVPASGSVSLPTRTLPREHVALTAAVVAAATALGKADDYVFDRAAGSNPSLVFFVDGNGGTPAHMLAAIDDLEHRLADKLPEEVELLIRWRGDSHRAMSYWSYRQERRRADAGINGALVERSSDASIELAETSLEVVPATGAGATGNELDCKGSAKNQTDHSIALEVSCGNDWYQVLPSPLAAGQVGWWFAGEPITDDTDVAALRTASHDFRTAQNDRVISHDPAIDATTTDRIARADAIRVATGLQPVDWSWDGGDAAIVVSLVPPDDFGDRDDAARSSAAAAALAQLAPWIPAALDAPATTPIDLHIDLTSAHWTYRGGVLEVSDE